MSSETFCCGKAMQHLHHIPQFLLIILFTQLAPGIVAWDMTKVSIPIQNLGTIKHHRLEGLLQFKKLIISLKLYIVCYSQLLSSQEERCFYISARKKSINNQTMEYNENDEDTTVKDLK